MDIAPVLLQPHAYLRAARTVGIDAPVGHCRAADVRVPVPAAAPRVISPPGAQGLAQFMPATWAGEGIDGDGDGRRDPFNPADAIASQASFMCKLLKAVSGHIRLTDDPLELTLAAYNAGLGAVQRYRNVPPYPETVGYVRRIRALMATYADPAASAPRRRTARQLDPANRPAPLTSGFGQRWGRPHAGIDFGAPIGTAVYADSDGTVQAAGPVPGYGQWVKLAHAGGTTTVYGHISAPAVMVGQAVRTGQLIAYSGNEGRSTGPHLHFETRPGDRAVDSIAFYAAHEWHCGDESYVLPSAVATTASRTADTSRT